jgi:predicted amidohydrolase YtcJ
MEGCSGVADHKSCQVFQRTVEGPSGKGMDADLVVLDADPAADVRNFAKVAYTIRGGKVISRGGKVIYSAK